MAAVVFRHGLAACSGLIACRHAGAFVRSPAEAWRFLKKTFNCALCYVGLGARGTWREAWLAGRAAFLSTAFDAATDWRHFDSAAVAAFMRAVDRVTPDPETRRLTAQLLDQKRRNEFSNDGLERGVPALDLILRVMGCADLRRAEWSGLHDVGITLQLIDDVLDHDDDVRRGDLTSLTSARAATWLQTLLERERAGDFVRWFGERPSVVRYVAGLAAARARQLLATTTAATETRPVP